MASPVIPQKAIQSVPKINENASNPSIKSPSAANKELRELTNAISSPNLAIPSTKSHPKAARMIQAFRLFISIIFYISLFGATTSALIVRLTDLAELWPAKQPPFSTFLNIAWSCFIFSLAIAGSSLTWLFILWTQAKDEGNDAGIAKGDKYGLLASKILDLLITTSVMFSLLTVVPFILTEGWIVAALISLEVAFFIGLCLYQTWRIFGRTAT